MTLIFGGAYQGKLDYVLERFVLTDGDVYRCDEQNTVMPANRKVLYEIDKWILALTKENIDAEDAVRQLINNNPNAIVICNDISCGIVSVDPVMRKWREAVGRSMAELSRCSDEVVRVFCGIPTRLK